MCKGFKALGEDLADRPPEPWGARGSRMLRFVKDLKHLERIWRISLLSHEAPEAPECSVLSRICKGFEAFESDLPDPGSWATRHPRLQSAPFYKGFTRKLKHLKRIGQTSLLGQRRLKLQDLLRKCAWRSKQSGSQLMQLEGKLEKDYCWRSKMNQPKLLPS